MEGPTRAGASREPFDMSSLAQFCSSALLGQKVDSQVIGAVRATEEVHLAPRGPVLATPGPAADVHSEAQHSPLVIYGVTAPPPPSLACLYPGLREEKGQPRTVQAQLTASQGLALLPVRRLFLAPPSL